MQYNFAMQTITLYTKLNCSLCDKAYKILLAVAVQIPLEIDVIDIVQNNLEDKYGTRIPVVGLPNGDELNWPFTVRDIKTGLAAL
jgi:glutaredoxin